MPGRKKLVLLVAIFTTLAPAFAASTEAALYSFCSASGCQDGAYPYFGGVIFDAAGNLYGTTAYGGNTECAGNGCGTVFQLIPGSNGTWTHTVLHTFNGTSGAHPSGLILDKAGNLYGTTQKGGAHHVGTVYQLLRGENGTWSEKVLYSFNGKDGSEPNPGLIFDSAGNLYGTTLAGGGEKGGVLFQLVPGAKGTWTEKVLHSNYPGARGPGPYGTGGLTFDTSGSLYGTTVGGGVTEGEVFRLKPGASGKWIETVLYDFSSSNGAGGANPPGGLIFDAAGNLYGSTWGGGANGGCGGSGCGVVFQLTPDGNGKWTETVLHDFEGNDGQQPNARLVFDTAGNLYGTTAVGGMGSFGPGGTVFELTPSAGDSWNETVLYNFCSISGCADGSYSLAGVVLDVEGNLYGTTDSGGANQGNQYGTVFEVTQTGH
jgi:uncharacterized repeat protein (TIGR03803 family)